MPPRNHDTARYVNRDQVMYRFNTSLGDCPFCASSMVGLYLGPLPHVTCFNCAADGPLQEVLGDGLEAAQWRACNMWNKRRQAI